MQIRPCIDIHNGKVKQIVGSTLRDQQGAREGMALENFVADKDAAYYASLYKEMGLCGGHIILLNSAREKAYQADLAQARAALSAYQGGMQIGGGITAESAPSFLDLGASHVIVTSYVFRDGKLDEDALKKMLRAVGRRRLVLDLSCRRRARLSEQCDEFLIHAADVEGKRAGVEQELVRMIGAWQKKSGFPVTYAGGVHTYADLALIGDLSQGRTDVTVGSALSLFGGALDLAVLQQKAEEWHAR